MKFKYCPICGKRLEEKYSYDDGGVPYCVEDDVMYFDTPRPCIIVAVMRENMILMLKQSYTFKNSNVLVSGYVNTGETIEKTVLREVKEETGIIVKQPKYLGSYYLDSKEIIMLTFMAQYEAGDIIESEEVDWAGWVCIDNALSEMPEDKIGKSVVRKVIEEMKINY